MATKPTSVLMPVFVVACLLAACVAPAIGQPKIYYPKPKTGTLDDSTDSAGGAKSDTVLTVRGDRLAGRVVGIGADGMLRLLGPQFDGEVQVLTTALKSVSLRGRAAERGGDVVHLSNGDRIVGQVTAVTARQVIVESDVAGRLAVGRNFVQTVAFSGARTSLLESAFQDGSLDPWKILNGAWKVQDGQLVCGSGGRSTIYAPLKQTEAITFVVRVESLQNQSIQCSLVLFAQNNNRYDGEDSIVAMFQSSYFYLHRKSRRSGTRTIANRSLGSSIKSGILRVAYDPATGKAKVWLDARELGEYAVHQPPRNGNFVLLTSQVPCKISWIRVLPGIVSPDEDKALGKTGAQAGGGHVVEFGEADRMVATSLSLAGGKFQAQTTSGSLAFPAETLRRITFDEKNRQVQRRLKGDAKIHTDRSRMTLQLVKLDERHIVGKSDSLGTVKILRNAVKTIRFKIYPQ